jgi:hypothetical protein
MNNNSQLRSWELHDPEQDMVFFVDRVANKDGEQTSPREFEILNKDESSNFSAVSRATSLDLEYSFHNQQIKIPLSRIRNGFHRSPVFGPDKVIEDPRLIETHRRVMRDIAFVGLLVSLVNFAFCCLVGYPLICNNVDRYFLESCSLYLTHEFDQFLYNIR